MNVDFSDEIGRMAIEAMLFEVSATPKPGLVDRNNCGAHHDMDYFTFMSSTAALHAVFSECALIGQDCGQATAADTFAMLQRYGKEAEAKMFRVTNGVNTHKGMIFTLSLVCGAAGWLQESGPVTSDRICTAIKKLCAGLCATAFRDLAGKDQLTKGERIYLKHGFTGVRGEAESGFSTVRTVSLPVFSELLKDGCPLNDACVNTLLHLVAHTVDTNIISRHDLNIADYARKYAAMVLAQGGILTPRGRTLLKRMDADFISKYISPGGSADLLAVTCLLHAIDQKSLAGSRQFVRALQIEARR